jgi:archaellum component FlaC
MPIFTVEEAERRIKTFEKDILEIPIKYPDLSCQKQKSKIIGINQKINRWKEHINKTQEELADEFQHGNKLGHDRAVEYGRLGGKKRIFTEEVAKERIRERKKIYYQKTRDKKKLLDVPSNLPPGNRKSPGPPKIFTDDQLKEKTRAYNKIYYQKNKEISRE